VNAVRAEGRPPECQALGYDIEPWTIADSLAVELLLAWAASLDVWPAKIAAGRVLGAGGFERARWVAEGSLEASAAAGERGEALRLVDASILDVLADLPIDLTVHATAAAATRGAGDSPAALVAGELCVAPMLPVLAYLAHLEAPGLSVAGVALLGGVMFPLARNRTCAWATTTALVDDADCVLEEIDGIGSYRTEAGWAKLSIRHELVRVRGGESLKVEVAETRHGPLVSRVADQLAGKSSDARIPALAIRWGAQTLESGVPGWLALARSRSVLEAADAARLLDRGPVALEVVVGDAEGEVGRFKTGRTDHAGAFHAVPVVGWAGAGLAGKAAPAEPSPPVATSSAPAIAITPRTRWTAVPGANRDPATALSSRLDPGNPARSGSLLEAVLGALRDSADPAAATTVPLVVGALRAEARNDSSLLPIADLVESWDRVANPESAAAAVYYLTILHFLPSSCSRRRAGPRFSVVPMPRLARRSASPSLRAPRGCRTRRAGSVRSAEPCALRSAGWAPTAAPTPPRGGSPRSSTPRSDIPGGTGRQLEPRDHGGRGAGLSFRNALSRAARRERFPFGSPSHRWRGSPPTSRRMRSAWAWPGGNQGDPEAGTFSIWPTSSAATRIASSG
jgi:acyl-homoserine lactone acylase PvdQ